VTTSRLKIDCQNSLEERIRFESMISDIMVRFVNIPPDDVGPSIEVAFSEILGFLQVDRIGLIRHRKNSDSFQVIHAAYRNQISPVPVGVDLPIALFPYIYRKVFIEKAITSFVMPEDLPDKASIDKQTYENWKIKSCLNIPISAGNIFSYSMTITSVHQECVWPEIYIPRLRLLGGIFANVLDLKHTRMQLEDRLAFEELLARISAKFVNISLKQMDADIENAMHQIVEFLNLDRGILVRFSHANSRMITTHFSVVPGCRTAWNELDNEVIPWVLENIMRGEAVVFSCLEDLPIEAAKDREFFTSIGIKSNVTLPLMANGNVLGFLGCSVLRAERTWPKEVIQGLQLLADVFTNAVVRKQKEAQLQERFNEIRNLKKQLEKDNIYLQEQIDLLDVHEEIVCRSKLMKEVLTKAEQVARTDATVLIQGETGTGKELLAKAIHNLSLRKDRVMVAVNCACLPPTLIESELFGREKGAYTGAMTQMIGRFELADGSTIFLDEIGELPLDIQSKLLRVLEEGSFQRLGSTKTLQVNVRIIAATNRDLEEEVTLEKFRKDLYYRLNVFPICIPPLRERAEDISMLVWNFIRQLENKIGKRVDSVSRKSMDELQRYSWPGNVRELRNLIEYAMIITKGNNLVVPIPDHPSLTEKPVGHNLENIERSHIISVLEKTGWRISGTGGAAEILGLKRTTLQSKIKKLGIRRS
jgi:formate hydrogenlyase transcriptional activator